MATPETAADEQCTLEDAPQPPGEASDLASVRAYMLRLLEDGRGAEAVELLLGLLGQLREAHSSTAVRLQHALRQLYGRKSEKAPAGQLQLLLEMLAQPPPEAAPAESATDEGDSAASDAPAGQKSKKPPRRPPLRGAKALPAHLERREVHVAPAPEECTCP